MLSKVPRTTKKTQGGSASAWPKDGPVARHGQGCDTCDTCHFGPHHGPIHSDTCHVPRIPKKRGLKNAAKRTNMNEKGRSAEGTTVNWGVLLELPSQLLTRVDHSTWGLSLYLRKWVESYPFSMGSCPIFYVRSGPVRQNMLLFFLTWIYNYYIPGASKGSPIDLSTLLTGLQTDTPTGSVSGIYIYIYI